MYGDQGGAVTELIITCEAASAIEKGDALKLVGPYKVTSEWDYHGDSIFGQALADTHPGEAVPVKVRGVAVFRCAPVQEWAGSVGAPGSVSTATQVAKSISYGSCIARWGDNGLVKLFNEIPRFTRQGALVLKYDPERNEAHVLI